MTDLSRAAWRKGTRSTNGGNCVEIAACNGLIAVRDSKNRDDAPMVLTREAWLMLGSDIKHGKHDS
jgi:hypothetical protein